MKRLEIFTKSEKKITKSLNSRIYENTSPEALFLRLGGDFRLRAGARLEVCRACDLTDLWRFVALPPLFKRLPSACPANRLALELTARLKFFLAAKSPTSPNPALAK